MRAFLVVAAPVEHARSGDLVVGVGGAAARLPLRARGQGAGGHFGAWHTADGARWRFRAAGPADRERFDCFVRGHARGHPLQMWSWGEVKAGDGWVPRRFVLERGDAVVAAASAVERALPLPGRPRLWLAHRGPVCDPAAPEADRLWAGLRRAAAAAGALAVRCDPEWPVSEGAVLRAAGLRAVPPRASWPMGSLQPVRVWRIGLAGGEAAVFGRFEPHTRQDVRRAAKKGAQVRAGAPEDLDALYALERAAASRRGFALRDRGFFARLWTAWRDDGRLLVAEAGGRVIGAAWFVACGAGCWGQFAAAEPDARRLLPTVALYWAGIRWAIDRGCAFCDFGGIDWRPGRPDGLRDFKKGFGPGDLRFAGEHDLVVRPGAYRAFRLAEELRWAWVARAGWRAHRLRPRERGVVPPPQTASG